MNTPYYYYDMTLLGDTLDALIEAAGDYKIHYAVKANTNPRILKAIAERGVGADCVSGGEITAAIEAGFDPAHIGFAGVGKTDAEIELGLRRGIGCFNVESLAELEIIIEIAGRLGIVAPVALRVNPDIDAHTHHYITTGLAENKFGIDLSLLDKVVAECRKSPMVNLIGLHFHIGSQITITEPYKVLCGRINSLLDKYEAKGIKFSLINVGGGIGIDYEHPDAHPISDFKSFFDAFRANLNLRSGQQLIFEPGRSVVAQCGSLITRVIYVKEGVGKRFVITDAGMNDLIRPALYQAHHEIQNLTSRSSKKAHYDVVGPICESSDVFGENVELPVTSRGDLLAIRSAGAYGEVMASQYNSRKLPGAVYGTDPIIA